MKASPAAPHWARQLTLDVCAEAGVPPPARLTWRHRIGEQSTGITRRIDRIISVRAGQDELDQRLTLLHELAHWLTPLPRRRRGPVHHGRAFYETAFDLYLRYGLAAADALDLEAARYPSSLRHAVALCIPGAKAAMARRRQHLARGPQRTWRVMVPEHEVELERDGRWTVCATCRQRIVGRNLVRLRRSRRPARHVLLTRVAAA
jgi:hypothetical protein